MQLGYEIWGGVTAIHSTRRRILIVLLTFLLAAATVLVTASPASASDNGGHSATVSGVDNGDCTAKITFTNVTSFPPDDYDLLSIEIREVNGGSLITHQLDLLPVEQNETIMVTVGLTAGDYDAEAVATYDVIPHNGPEPVGLTETSQLFDVTCEDFSSPGYSGTISCVGTCTVATEGTGGAVAQVNIVTISPFLIVLETDEKGPSPGKAFVLVDKDGDPDDDGNFFNDPADFQLPNCGQKGTEPTTNCVHINRVSGNHTEYTIFFTGDPRFRFR